MEEPTQLAHGLALSAGMLGPLTLALMSIRKAIAVDELPRWLSAIAAVAALTATALFLTEIWGTRLGWSLPSPRLYLSLMMASLIVGATAWTLSALVTRYRPAPYDFIALVAFLLAFPLGALTYWITAALTG